MQFFPWWFVFISPYNLDTIYNIQLHGLGSPNSACCEWEKWTKPREKVNTLPLTGTAPLLWLAGRGVVATSGQTREKQEASFLPVHGKLQTRLDLFPQPTRMLRALQVVHGHWWSTGWKIKFCALHESSLVYQSSLTNHAQNIESALGTVSVLQVIFGEEKFITRRAFSLQYLATQRVVWGQKNDEVTLQPTW